MKLKFNLIRSVGLLSVASTHFRKSLLLINMMIFFAIFAASAAVISLYFENKIADEEYYLIDTNRTMKTLNNYIPVMDGLLNSYQKSDHERQIFLFYNNFLFQSNMGYKIIDEAREFWLKPFYFLLEGIHENYEEGEEEGLSKTLNIMKEHYLLVMSHGNLTPDEDKLKKIDNLLSDELEYRKKYKEIVKSIEIDEQFKTLDLDDLFVDALDSKKRKKYEKFRKKYKDYYDFALDFEDFSVKTWKMVKSIITEFKHYHDQQIAYSSNLIKKYSKNESRSIFIAFIFQLLIFIVIQFFEISVTSLEVKKSMRAKK